MPASPRPSTAPSTAGSSPGNSPQAAAFEGFPPDAFRFLAELERDNSREFMDAHRARFEESVRGPALAFVRAVSAGLSRISPFFEADDARRGGSLLRMHRDVRFAADRRPYHESVVLRFPHDHEDPRAAPHCALRLTSRSVEISAGWRAPERRSLGALREAIDAERVAWASARLDASQRSVFGDLGEPELVRVPNGWPPDHPFAGDLRRKSFVLRADLPVEVAHDPLFPDAVVHAWATASPLLRFIVRALGLPWAEGETARLPGQA